MTDNTYRKVKRGPLVSSREVITKEDLAKVPVGVLREKMFAQAVERRTYDLIHRIGFHGNKITVTIEPLKSEHPQAPGWMIAAKHRRP